jgi:hypothetical protein
VRWLKENLDDADGDPAGQPFPLTRDDFLPRGLQYGVYGLVLAALLAQGPWPD